MFWQYSVLVHSWFSSTLYGKFYSLLEWIFTHFWVSLESSVTRLHILYWIVLNSKIYMYSVLLFFISWKMERKRIQRLHYYLFWQVNKDKTMSWFLFVCISINETCTLALVLKKNWELGEGHYTDFCFRKCIIF